MASLNLTASNLNQLIEGNDIVLIDFWAPWCGPCRAFKPVFEKAAAAHPEIAFAACNTEEQQELAAELGIRSIPTLMAFREGVLLYSRPGMLPAEALEDLIAKTKALDMARVHAEIATREQHAAATS